MLTTGDCGKIQTEVRSNDDGQGLPEEVGLTSLQPSDVAATAWPWRKAREGAGTPKAVTRRKRAAIEAAVAAAVGALFWFKFHKPVPAGIAWMLAALTLLGGLFVPPLYAVMKAAGVWLGKAVGIAFSWVLLVPFFYICFTAGRLILLLSGKDPLHREFRPDLKTYWTERKPISGPEHYTRQY